MQTISKLAIAYAINSLWQLPLLFLAGEIVTRVLGRARGKVLCRVWWAALILTFICPALAFLAAPPQTADTIAPAPRVAESRLAVMSGPLADGGAKQEKALAFASANSLSGSRDAIEREFSKMRGSASIWILYLYLASIVLAAARLGRGLWQTYTLMRGAVAAERDETLEATWTACKTFMGISDVELLSAAALSIPATLHWPRAMVLIPPSLESADSSEMSTVFCHELAHVIRRDFIWNLAAEIVGVLLFYHPVFHWMRRRIQETREMACDDLAAEAVCGRHDYARNLLRLTQKMLSTNVVAQPGNALGIFEGEVLERRIMNLLGKKSKLPMIRIASSTALGTCLVLLACFISVNFGMKISAVYAQPSNVANPVTSPAAKNQIAAIAEGESLVSPAVNLRTNSAPKEHNVMLAEARPQESSAPSSRTNHPPKGWFLAGDKPANYDTGVDNNAINNGQPSAFLVSKVANTEGFGTLMQSISASDYVGKRVSLRAWVKPQDVVNWAGVWMRVDKGKQSVAFDNMQNRPIKGTQAWNLYEVVLDVPPGSTGISFGILLSGAGEVWMNNLSFEVVGNDVPLTGIAEGSVAEHPTNLNFSE